MLQDPNVGRYVENAIKPLKKEIAKLKLQIEELNKALRIHAVVGRSEQLVCDCPSETFAKHYKGDGKCGYCGGKAES